MEVVPCGPCSPRSRAARSVLVRSAVLFVVVMVVIGSVMRDSFGAAGGGGRRRGRGVRTAAVTRTRHGIETRFTGYPFAAIRNTGGRSLRGLPVPLLPGYA
ncbi:hypothetical protein Acsp01_69670 [Actinoplanes sp. NBRC 101535]|nr:hypothetical protein Acsp01_69670 [Actinoplanes sp. NBRC 101535]